MPSPNATPKRIDQLPVASASGLSVNNVVPIHQDRLRQLQFGTFIAYVLRVVDGGSFDNSMAVSVVGSGVPGGGSGTTGGSGPTIDGDEGTY